MRGATVCALGALIALLFATGPAAAAPRKRPAPEKTPPAKQAPAPEPEPAPAPKPKAPASDKRTLAVLDVRLEGVPDDVRQRFEDELVDSLDPSSYWVAPPKLVRERMAYSTQWTDGCVVGECIRAVKAQTGADVALLVAVSGSGTSFGYVVTVVRTDTGKVFAQRSGRCEMCVVDKVMNEVILEAFALVNGIPEKLPDEDAERAAAVDLAVNKLVKRIDSDARAHRREGITMMIVGLAVGAVGAGLYFVADKPDFALAIGGAGGGLALGGVSVLVF